MGLDLVAAAPTATTHTRFGVNSNRTDWLFTLLGELGCDIDALDAYLGNETEVTAATTCAFGCALRDAAQGIVIVATPDTTFESGFRRSLHIADAARAPGSVEPLDDEVRDWLHELSDFLCGCGGLALTLPQDDSDVPAGFDATDAEIAELEAAFAATGLTVAQFVEQLRAEQLRSPRVPADCPATGAEVTYLEQRVREVYDIWTRLGLRPSGGTVYCAPDVWRRVRGYRLSSDTPVGLLRDPRVPPDTFEVQLFSLHPASDEEEFPPARGIVYPGPVTQSHMDMRWTLQEIDGMAAADAEQAAARL